MEFLSLVVAGLLETCNAPPAELPAPTAWASWTQRGTFRDQPHLPLFPRFAPIAMPEVHILVHAPADFLTRGPQAPRAPVLPGRFGCNNPDAWYTSYVMDRTVAEDS